MESRLDAIHEQASALAGGLDDFGDADYLEPLRMLLSDHDEHANLSDVGREVIGGGIANDLAGRLHEEAGFKEHAACGLDDAIEDPIFIVGMARTGTTFLQRLLSADPAAQGLPFWLGNKPMRRPPEEDWEANPFYQQAQAGLDALGQMAPRFHEIHPQHASAPDECRFLLNHSFRSPSLAVLATAPTYEEWINQADLTPVYRRYKRSLNLIGDADRRWVLKCPSHLWSLATILEVFPTARIVFTHRDPGTAFPSLFSLVSLVRGITDADFSPEEYGRHTTDTWGWVLDKSERDRRVIPDNQIYDIQMNVIRQDPVAAAEAIYAHFGLKVSDDARTVWTAMTTESPTGGHASHSFKAEDYGLTEEEIRHSTGSYFDRYVQVEQVSAPA